MVNEFANFQGWVEGVGLELGLDLKWLHWLVEVIGKTA